MIDTTNPIQNFSMYNWYSVVHNQRITAYRSSGSLSQESYPYCLPKHIHKLDNHSKPSAISLLDNSQSLRRLKKNHVPWTQKTALYDKQLGKQISLGKSSNVKVFILPRVAELFIHKEKQRGCPLLGANRYTHIYIKYICVYILFICLRL